MMVLGEADKSDEVMELDLLAMPSVSTIRSRGTLRVLVNSYTPGLAFRSAEDAPIQGFEIDFARSLTKLIFGTSDIDSHLELIECDTAQRIAMLKDDEVDLIIANLYDTAERRNTLDFAGHYLSQRYVPLLVSDSPDVTRPDDLAGLRVAVEADSTDEDILRRIAPDAEVVPMVNATDWRTALTSKSVQAFWTDTTYGPAMIRDFDSTLRLGALRAGVGHAAVGIRRGQDDLRNVISDFVSHKLVTGELSTSLRHWGL